MTAMKERRAHLRKMLVVVAAEGRFGWAGSVIEKLPILAALSDRFPSAKGSAIVEQVLRKGAGGSLAV